jgi:predicted NBD/HSP70 family sugar kinase
MDDERADTPPRSARAPRRREPARSGNLSAVLRHVHRAPATRSELTRSTGLNRSTIATLVTELARRGLVDEHDATAGGGVGRPSPLVRAGDRAVAIAIHPEIDAVRVAAVLLGGRVLHRIRVDCDRPDADEVLAVVERAVADLRMMLPTDSVVVGAGVAVPGLVRLDDGFVRLAPHLDWHDVPLAARLTTALGMPVMAANEASLGAAAEWTFGAGRGVDDLLYVNGGASGIGGGIVAGGVPLLGTSGHAGEIGHVVVRSDTVRDTAGLPGTLEAHVTREALGATLAATAQDPDEFERAVLASTSAATAAVVAQQIDDLAVALASVVNVLGSRRIVLGGFLGALTAADGDRLRAAVDARLLGPIVGDVAIRRAELGADLLLVGAASLPFAAVLADVPDLHAPGTAAGVAGSPALE